MSPIDFSVLDSVKPGDRITVRFTENASEDLIYVVAMKNAGVLTIGNNDLLFLDAVRATNDWEGDNNRTQTFTVGPRWSKDFFEGRMRRAIESLEVTLS